MKQKRAHQLAVVTLFVFSSCSLCYATHETDNDALELPATKISMAQAVTIAEQQGAGKAVRAELEKYDRQYAFDVEVVNGNTVMDIKVDPGNGKLLATSTDVSDDDYRNDVEE